MSVEAPKKRRIFNFRNVVAGFVGAAIIAPEVMGISGTSLGAGMTVPMGSTPEGRTGMVAGVAMGNNDTNVASFKSYALPYLGRHQPLGVDTGLGPGGYRIVLAMTGGDKNLPSNAEAYGHRVSTGEAPTNLTTVNAPRQRSTTIGSTGP